ncbi:BTB/POZ domain-containing protein KCTD7-like [Saccostrea cucullata]|uniref:BTB/POZ domain-containing protein KCTD7-like n=1 Tax=Saccostrea cuccullata TaxID=36930 RepID=UPI002ED69D2F
MKYGEEERKEFAEFQRQRSTLVEAYMKEVVPNFNPTPGAKRAICIDTVVPPKKQKVDNKGDNDQKIPAPGPVPSPKPVEQPQPQPQPRPTKSENSIKDVLSLNAPEEESYEVQESNETPTYNPTDQMEVKLNILKEQQDGHVILNVGGRKFETSRRTLSSDPSSLLAAMTNPKSPIKPCKETYFIDRNPRYFDFVLDYLRYPEAFPNILPSDFTLLRQLHVEGKFYGLSGLVLAIEKKGQTQPLWEEK